MQRIEVEVSQGPLQNYDNSQSGKYVIKPGVDQVLPCSGRPECKKCYQEKISIEPKLPKTASMSSPLANIQSFTLQFENKIKKVKPSNKLLKIFSIFALIIILLLAIAIVWISLYELDSQKLKVPTESIENLNSFCIRTIPFAILLFLVTIGEIGSLMLRRSRLVVITATVLQILVLFGSLVFLIDLILLSKDSDLSPDEAKKIFHTEMKNNNKIPKYVPSWLEKFQLKSTCCGILNYTDYEEAWDKATTPASCCLPALESRDGETPPSCPTDLDDLHYPYIPDNIVKTKGCFEGLAKENKKSYTCLRAIFIALSIFAGLSHVLLTSMFCSSLLRKGQKNESGDKDDNNDGDEGGDDIDDTNAQGTGSVGTSTFDPESAMYSNSNASSMKASSMSVFDPLPSENPPSGPKPSALEPPKEQVLNKKIFTRMFGSKK